MQAKRHHQEDPRAKPLGWCFEGNVDAFSGLFPALRWEEIPASTSSVASAVVTELENRRSMLCLAPVSYDTLPTLARQRWIRPLDAWFPGPYMARYAPQAVELATVDGRLYGIPDDIVPYVFFVRRDILQHFGLPPPRTWGEVEALIGRLRKEKRRWQMVMGGGQSARLAFLLAVLGSNGVPLTADADALLRSPDRLTSAYEWVRRVSAKHGFPPFEMLTHPRSSQKMFGKLGDTVAIGFGWSYMFHGMSRRLQERFVVLPFPRGPGLPEGVEPYAPMRGACWCLPAGQASPEAAVAALRAMHGPEVRRAIPHVEAFPFYPLRDRWRDPDLLRRHPVYRHADAVTRSVRPVLAAGGIGCFHRLEATFRNALLDGLDGPGWVADLTSRQEIAPGPGEAPSIRYILAGVEARLARLRGVNAIAREMGYRADRLRRVFRKHTGEELTDYVRKRRMAEGHVQRGCHRTQSWGGLPPA
jgi:AraC-like DNA-binding protein